MDGFSGDNLTCIRGERTVFVGLNFALAAGDVLYLLGPNGSGKSSLLRMMAGFIRPAAGRLIWNGEDVMDDLSLHRSRVSYVGHLDAIKGVLTVAENLSFWAELAGRADTVEDALNRFSLARLATTPARFLSAGQRRRLNLARLLAAPSPLWLLDEPATALDTESAEILATVIAAHQGTGGFVVQATHDEPPEGAMTLDFRAPAARAVA